MHKRTQKLQHLAHVQTRIVLNGVTLGILTTFKDRPDAQQLMANIKQTQWYFCRRFASFVWNLCFDVV